MKILIAEDETISRHLLESTLRRWGYEVVVAQDGSEAWRLLQADERPSIAILDWIMPGLDGKEVCRRLRGLPPDSYVYVFLLTAKTGKENFIEGMEAGADDYISKPFDPGELQVRLRVANRIIELQQVLREQATKDPLTGLWNRGGVFHLLGQELERSKREGQSVGVVLMDIDHFKQINDTYGHLIGDQALRETAHRILTWVRPYDLLGRYGGEEFLLVLPRCGLEAATRVAERIHSHVRSMSIAVSQHRLSITLSLGVAIGNPEAPLTLEALVQAADTALYRAKQNGRDRVEIAVPG